MRKNIIAADKERQRMMFQINDIYEEVTDDSSSGEKIIPFR